MGARVLVVDDDPWILRMVTATLQKKEFVVDTAREGRQALERAQANPPDVIISDVMMPVMDGWTFVQRLRAIPRLAAIPVIFLTALGKDEAKLRALGMGPDDFLPKPFRFEELEKRVASALRGTYPPAPVPAAVDPRAAPHPGAMPAPTHPSGLAPLAAYPGVYPYAPGYPPQPGQPPGAMPGQPPGAMPGQPPGAMPGQPPGAMPGQPPGAMPGQPPMPHAPPGHGAPGPYGPPPGFAPGFAPAPYAAPGYPPGPAYGPPGPIPAAPVPVQPAPPQASAPPGPVAPDLRPLNTPAIPGSRRTTALNGRIEQLGLSSLLVMMEMERKDGVLSLRDSESTMVGRIFLRGGQVISAKLDERSDWNGRECVYTMLAWRAGTFSFSATKVDMEDTIDSSTTHLLMEGARRIDEANRDGEPSDDDGDFL